MLNKIKVYTYMYIWMHCIYSFFMFNLLFIFLATLHSVWDFSSQPGVEPRLASGADLEVDTPLQLEPCDE